MKAWIDERSAAAGPHASHMKRTDEILTFRQQTPPTQCFIDYAAMAVIYIYMVGRF